MKHILMIGAAALVLAGPAIAQVGASGADIRAGTTGGLSTSAGVGGATNSTVPLGTDASVGASGRGAISPGGTAGSGITTGSGAAGGVGTGEPGVAAGAGAKVSAGARR